MCTDGTLARVVEINAPGKPNPMVVCKECMIYFNASVQVNLLHFILDYLFVCSDVPGLPSALF